MRKLIWFITGLFMLQSGAFAIDDNQKMLIKAMRKNDVSTVTSLIEKGTDLNFEMGLTPLVMAIRAGNLTLVDTMLAAGAEVNFTESQPANALVSAAATGNEVMLKRILDAGADINARAHGVPYRTALMQASESGHMALVALLVKRGADLTIGDYNDDQALAFAAYYNQPAIITFLVEQGADINHISTPGLTPLDHAVRSESKAAEQLLRQLGAQEGSELKANAG